MKIDFKKSKSRVRTAGSGRYTNQKEITLFVDHCQLQTIKVWQQKERMYK